MGGATNWRNSLSVADRYANVETLTKAIATKGCSATGTEHKSAFEAETEAYNTSSSREEYNAACHDFTLETPSEGEALESNTPGIPIGPYQSCHHIASGLVSEVYRCRTIALKVITETRNAEPHDGDREVKILNSISHSTIISLVSTFRDAERRLVLEFPYMPLTLAKLLGSQTRVERKTIRGVFRDLFSALVYLHAQGIIHRDIKPSNLLLGSPTGPAYLSDFGTSYHPTLSLPTETPSYKVLEVGTTCYRAPETLFGNRSYSTSLDLWAAGTLLVECLREDRKPLFESRETSEDGNQLGLILSIFKTLGTPTEESWPEAKGFTTPPFKWYTKFPGKSWEELLVGLDEVSRDLVSKLVVYESGDRMTASEALEHTALAERE